MATMNKGSRPAPMLLYLVAGASLLYIIYTRVTLYLRRRRIIQQNGCKPVPRYPYKDRLFGTGYMRDNIRNARNKVLLQSSQERFRKMGNTFRTRVLTTPYIMTIEPENIKTVLSLKFKDYSLGHDFFRPLIGHGIFNSDGERWASSRHLLRPNFSRDQVHDIEALERHLVWFFKAIPGDGSTVDLQELFFRMTIDTASEFLFNHSVHSLRVMGTDERNQDLAFMEAFRTALQDAYARSRLGKLAWFKRDKKSMDALKMCHEYVDRFVDEALRYREKIEREGPEKEEKYIFLHELAKATTDKQTLRDELLSILLAGRDTTAGLLSNMWFQIAKRPDVFAKLREEVSSLGGLPPTYEQLRDLKYLKWCMNEALRLYPVGPFNSRLAIIDTLLPTGGGPTGTSPVFVPRGTHVAYSVYSMQRRTDLYGPDAAEFRPERWEELRPRWEYLPFNGGPRRCLGEQYALTEAGYVSCRIAQRFAGVESRQGEWVEDVYLILSSAGGVKVGLTPA